VRSPGKKLRGEKDMLITPLGHLILNTILKRIRQRKPSNRQKGWGWKSREKV